MVQARDAHAGVMVLPAHFSVYPHDDFLWSGIPLDPEGGFAHWKGGLYYLLGYGVPAVEGALFPYAAEKIHAIYMDLRGESGVWARKFFGPDGWNTPVSVEGKEVKRFRRIALVDLGGCVGAEAAEVPVDSLKPLLDQVRILNREASKLARKMKRK